MVCPLPLGLNQLQSMYITWLVTGLVAHSLALFRRHFFVFVTGAVAAASIHLIPIGSIPFHFLPLHPLLSAIYTASSAVYAGDSHVVPFFPFLTMPQLAKIVFDVGYWTSLSLSTAASEESTAQRVRLNLYSIHQVQ